MKLVLKTIEGQWSILITMQSTSKWGIQIDSLLGGTGWGCLEMDVRYRLNFDYYFTSIWSLWIALDELRWISMGVLRGPVVGRRWRRHRPVLISTRVLDLLSRARPQSLTFPLDKFHRNCPLGKAQTKLPVLNVTGRDRWRLDKDPSLGFFSIRSTHHQDTTLTTTVGAAPPSPVYFSKYDTRLILKFHSWTENSLQSR